MMLSIITPAFNEAANLVALYERLLSVMTTIGDEWEWVIVDDHSLDDTFLVIEQLFIRDSRVRGLRLARNSGSHIAIACGLHHAQGDAAVMMAADLQDPPETLREMVDRWRDGSQVVWAVRRERPGDRAHAGFAALYYWIMRRMPGLTDMPIRGADYFLIDRLVIDAFRQFPERSVSVLALITWLGFRQTYIEYHKQPRAGGQSGWTLARKIALVVDSVTAFSHFPIRLCAVTGALLMASAFVFGLVSALRGGPAGLSLSTLLAVIVGFAGLQLVAIGLVGEYVWRALEEARRRPHYLIERLVGAPSSKPAISR